MISSRHWMTLLALWAVLAVLTTQAVRSEEYDDDEIDEEDERILTRAGRYEDWRRKQEASGFAVPPLHAQEGEASHIHPPLDPKDEPRTTTTRKDVCIENPLGEACRIQTIARQEQRQREERQLMDERAQASERQAFADTAEVLRGGLNRWACAATGVPLYSVRGDRDVLNYFTNLVAQVLTGEGHEPAATLVLKDAMDHQALLEQRLPTCEHLQRVMEEHPDNDALAADPDAARREREAQRSSPEGLQARAAREIEFSEARQRDLALERVMVNYYSAMRALLQPKGFWSDDMWPRVEPEMRVVISRWAVARLVYSFEQCVTGAKSAAEAEKLATGCPARETETLLGLIAFVKADGRSQQLEHCVTGGELRRIMDTSREGRLSREVQRLLDACVEGGRLSSDPVEFGEVLRRAGRDAEARDLFDTAVSRGKLCNAWQRPEFYHRKDLTAAPLWSAEVAPELQEYLPLLRMRLSEAVASNFSFADDAYTSTHDVTRLGRWDRVSIYGHHQFNEIACDALGRGICDDMASMIRVLRSNNDGYESSCNGSTVVELWRLSGDAFESETAVGPSNIVLQALVPIRGNRRFIVTVAEEAAFLDPESAQQNPASDQDILIFDDSFEHRIQTEDAAASTASIDAARIGGALPLWYYRAGSDAVAGAGAGAAAAAAAAIGAAGTESDRSTTAAAEDLVLLHIQLCHPELHEKALDKPSGRCATEPY